MDNGEQGILNDLLSFTDSDLNIMMFYNFAEESSIDGLVPFARDPFGNLLCFDYRLNKTSPQVIFFDHEEAGEEAVIPVCSTFTELLDGLYSIE
ncbi:SMI1 / KNR4 family protein [compost metagenome]